MSPVATANRSRSTQAPRGTTRPASTERSSAATVKGSARTLMDQAGAVIAMLDEMQARVMVADANLDLVYVNNLALRTMRSLEPHLLAAFGVSVDDLLGDSIHRFHRDPRAVERTLADLSGFPRDVTFAFGPVTISTRINLIRDGGEVLGYVVVWEDVTERLATERLAKESSDDARAMIEIMSVLARAERPEDAAQFALDAVRRTFGWAYGSYWAIDPADQALRYSVESGDAGPEFRKVTREASFREGVGLSGRAWRSRDLVFVADLAEVTDCVRAPVAQRVGVKSGIAFPIVVDGAVVGTMDFFATETLEPSQNRLDTLRSVGSMVSG